MRIDLDYPPEEAVPYVELYEKTHKLLKEEEKRARRLEERRDELLALVAKLSQSVPLDSEVAEALAQRGKLLAEVGTLRSRIRELEEQLAEAHDRKLEPFERSEQVLLWFEPEEPPEDCLHNYLTASILDGEIIGQNCMICWLPVGVPCDPEPAADTPEALEEILCYELGDFDLDPWWLFRETRRNP